MSRFDFKCFCYAVLSSVIGLNLGFAQEVIKQGLAEEALEILKASDFVNREQLTDLPSLEKLVKDKLVAFTSTKDLQTSEQLGRAGEFLLPGVFYLSLRHWSQLEMERVHAELLRCVELKGEVLLMDLRTEQNVAYPEDLVSFLEAFVRSGAVLFRRCRGDDVLDIYTSSRAPIWKGGIYVLLDRESSATACFIASLLRSHLNATVLGDFQVREMWHFENAMLSEEMTLHYADSTLRLEPQSSPIEELARRKVPLKENLEGKRLWRSDPTQDLKSRLFEIAPHRFDELALMSGDDPEIDHLLQSSMRNSSVPDVKDLGLQQAVDLVLAKRFLKPSKMTLQDSPKGGTLPNF